VTSSTHPLKATDFPVDAGTVRKAERLIESCEYCNEEGAEIPFDTSSTVLPAQIRP
jgi:hypothetical protein